MSKKPTGIKISRQEKIYTVSWKCGDKNYSSGQQLQYRINNKGKWTSVSIGTGTRSKSIKINLDDYYPTTNDIFDVLSIRIRGKKRGSKWSAWATKTYTNYVPDIPNLDVALDDQLTNKSTFTWNLTTEETDSKPYKHVRWETILVKDCDVTDGSQLTWDSSVLGWDTGIGSSADSITKTEDTTLLAQDSYTRWVRVCGRGAKGSSAWRYEKHVYARPYQARIEYTQVSLEGAEGLSCVLQWVADQPPSHPIDSTTVQYLITTPNDNMTCPSGAQWNDANISADTTNTDAARFSIDDIIGKDECMFVRVNTLHDSNITYGSPVLVDGGVGALKDPTDLVYQTDNENHTLTSVSIDNNSDVPDSFIVLLYRGGSSPDTEIAVGIIPHNASQPIVLPVVCPDWSDEEEFSIGAYAAVGSYEANASGLGYIVNAKMRSAQVVWVGGAVPVAPENVNVMPSIISRTVTVTWDWTWSEATRAQLSWTDHNDAWESTDEPEIYTINKSRPTRWNISGLEAGVKWYIAVRLVKGDPDGDGAIYGPWSALQEVTLSSVPSIPSLILSPQVITVGDPVTASWGFESTDGTGQASAEICEVVSTPYGNQYGTYRLSDDTTVIVIEDEEEVLNGKEYYTKTGDYTYVKVEEINIEDNPVENGWYEYQAFVAHATTENEIIIDTSILDWSEGETHNLSVRVTSEMGRTTDWSNPISVIIAKEISAEISDTSLVEDSEIITADGDVTVRYFNSLTEMPLEVTVSGGGNDITTTLTIERAEDYHIDRPDETQFDGFEGETVYLTTLQSAEEITINKEDLLGLLDDGAKYKIVLTNQDIYGQNKKDELEFEVHWAHQAIIPEATCIIDDENLIARLTPIAPTGTLTGDTCDIYRLSADRPELIIKDASFGTEYVDPYPAIGEFGGHRFVFKTSNGDYITEDNDMAWTETRIEEGDLLEIDRTIIDFDGNQLLLYYNVDVGHEWEKDFQETKYLGGSVQGDWNAAVSRSGSLSAVMITITDQEQIQMLRQLAVYTGACHVRTKDGSSFTANVDVSEDRDHDDFDKIVSFSMEITRIDPESLDGLTYEQWAQEEED